MDYERAHRDAAVARPTRTSGLAIASLVLGIVGLVLLPLIASVAAIFVGRKARNDLARDPTLAGEGLAKAGVILGWIGVAFIVVTFLVAFFIAAVMA